MLNLIGVSLRGALRLLALLLVSLPSLAQEVSESTPNTGANVVRFDFLAPVGANLLNNLFVQHDLIFPILFSYERRIGPAWSLGVEGLLNGGVSPSQRNGVALSVRRYLKSNSALAGPYLSPMMSYRQIKDVSYHFGPSSPVIVRAKRIGTGALLGWQLPLGYAKPRRWTLDMAVGAIYWGRVGSDTVEDITNSYHGPDAESSRDGWWVDLRGGLGYQF